MNKTVKARKLKQHTSVYTPHMHTDTYACIYVCVCVWRDRQKDDRVRDREREEGEKIMAACHFVAGRGTPSRARKWALV